MLLSADAALLWRWLGQSIFIIQEKWTFYKTWWEKTSAEEIKVPSSKIRIASNAKPILKFFEAKAEKSLKPVQDVDALNIVRKNAKSNISEHTKKCVLMYVRAWKHLKIAWQKMILREPAMLALLPLQLCSTWLLMNDLIQVLKIWIYHKYNSGVNLEQPKSIY